ncbi:hypothetical protein FF38_07195 [Lucilia cuprina]|uniref:Uncharacterized protein n=1 Tax=Lucilia cuprina TaxID=7375 RepID=A0A0L0BSX8_LUCCU|nr:hypothetical protein FF38_07195 [Lucilia cuprina]
MLLPNQQSHPMVKRLDSSSTSRVLVDGPVRTNVQKLPPAFFIEEQVSSSQVYPVVEKDHLKINLLCINPSEFINLLDRPTTQQMCDLLFWTKLVVQNHTLNYEGKCTINSANSSPDSQTSHSISAIILIYSIAIVAPLWDDRYHESSTIKPQQVNDNHWFKADRRRGHQGKSPYYALIQADSLTY